MTDDDLEAAALIDLTDDLQQAVDSEKAVPVGGCLSAGLTLILILVAWLAI